MSYWSHHPEELEEVTVENLPEPYKSMVENEEMYYGDVPQDILGKAMDEGVADYWGNLVDEAQMMMEDR